MGGNVEGTVVGHHLGPVAVVVLNVEGHTLAEVVSIEAEEAVPVVAVVAAAMTEAVAREGAADSHNSG